MEDDGQCRVGCGGLDYTMRGGEPVTPGSRPIPLATTLPAAVACPLPTPLPESMLRIPSSLLVVMILAGSASAQSPLEARLILLPDTTGPVISRHVYGHFAEHLGRNVYDGFWVGEDSDIPNVRGVRSDLVAALKEIGVPNLRWPGGCFADIYHWRDGIGPREDRPTVPNRFWGRAMEDNSFGTHEFMDLAAQLGATPYIAGNLGSGTVQEMSDWAEYLTAGDGSPMALLRQENGREEPWEVGWIGVGNESWGCGGNMRAAFYADLYRQYATYLRQYAPGVPLVAAGPSAGFGGYGSDLEWTETLMREAGGMMQGYSLHYYTVTHNWTVKGSATDFTEDEWFTTLYRSTWMDSVVTAHGRIMDQYDPEKRIAIVMDEWGTWYDVEPGTPGWGLFQQNTLRDGLVAAITLNILNNHADRVRVANLAQAVNVLQALVLTDGPRMLLTPTYDVFAMYKGHQDGRLVPSRVEGPQLSNGEEAMPMVSASVSDAVDGTRLVTLSNAGLNRAVRVVLSGTYLVQGAEVLTAEAMNAHNTFEEPSLVRRQTFSRASVVPGGVEVVLPPKSVVAITLRRP